MYTLDTPISAASANNGAAYLLNLAHNTVAMKKAIDAWDEGNEWLFSMPPRSIMFGNTANGRGLETNTFNALTI
jgi:hypothetical protein